MKETDVIKDLIRIKESIESNNKKIYEDDMILSKLEELDKKIEELRQMQTIPAAAVANVTATRISREESPVKAKRKNEILDILKENKKLTATQLGIITGMSRTRCNEYLRDLEAEGKLKGIITDKKKFYRLI